MRLKVIHLSNYLQKVERDIEEIHSLKSSLHENRSYAKSINNSLLEEEEKLASLREKILKQVIKVPSHFSIDLYPKETETFPQEKETKKNWTKEVSIHIPKYLSSTEETKNLKVVSESPKPFKEEKEEDLILSKVQETQNKDKKQKQKEELPQSQISRNFPFIFHKN